MITFDHRTGDPFRLWLLAIIPAFFFLLSANIFPLNFIIYYVSMIVHEVGHTFFGLLALIPGISFLFVSFSLSQSPLWKMAFILIPAEIAAIYYFLNRRRVYLCAYILSGFIALQICFLLFVKDAHWFVVFGGLAGEMILPLLIIIFLTPFNRPVTPKGIMCYAISCVVFWHSLFEWILAFLGLGKIPYPRDSEGGLSVMQGLDPFSVGQGPSGDIDKLIINYGWSESFIINTYTLFGFSVLLGYILFWRYRSRLQVDSGKQVVAASGDLKSRG